ncbi:MAG: serine/threonine-protein kinase, partial [Myxococcota bacterium]
MEGLVPAEVERLGPYLLLERLAPYGMVQPYLARRDGAIDLVVVKRLLPQLVRHPTAPRRFAREARLTRMLEHPHLVRTVDVGYANDELFMATELVAGVRLDVLMINAIARGRPLPLDVVSGLVQRVLAGLGHAHRAQDAGRPLGIVHRDLTPRSITVAFTGAVKLGDFGVARAKGDAALTAPGTAVGTLAYMSPEQVDRAPLDARTDLYSFSVLLYELLTGRPMVDAQDALSILKQVRELNPMPLRDRRPELPERLAQVVQRGLAKDVEDRWPDALSYEHALQEALQEVGPSASSERLGAFVRACLPDEEDHFLQMLNRVRSVSSTLPAEAYEEAPIPFDDDDDEPLPEPTPEPSVMTMPGLSLPMQQRVAVARARGPSPRRLWLMGSVVVALAALAT